MGIKFSHLIWKVCFHLAHTFLFFVVFVQVFLSIRTWLMMAWQLISPSKEGTTIASRKKFPKQWSGRGGSVLGRRFTAWSREKILLGSSWALMAVINRAQMKAERVSIRVGRLGNSPKVLSENLSRRASIFEAENTNLLGNNKKIFKTRIFVSIIFFKWKLFKQIQKIS